MERLSLSRDIINRLKSQAMLQVDFLNDNPPLVGSLAYVAEPWASRHDADASNPVIRYSADYEWGVLPHHMPEAGKYWPQQWSPSVEMPDWASRFVVQVVSVEPRLVGYSMVIRVLERR